MLRVALRRSRVAPAGDGSARSGVCRRPVVPTEADGAVRLYFSPRRADRYVSAVDVLAGRVDPARCADSSC